MPCEFSFHGVKLARVVGWSSWSESGHCACAMSTPQKWTVCSETVQFVCARMDIMRAQCPLLQSGHNACALSTSIRDEVDRDGRIRPLPPSGRGARTVSTPRFPEWTLCVQCVHSDKSGRCARTLSTLGPNPSLCVCVYSFLYTS